MEAGFFTAGDERDLSIAREALVASKQGDVGPAGLPGHAQRAIVDRQLRVADNDLPQVAQRSPLVRADVEIGKHAAREVLRTRALAETEMDGAVGLPRQL